MNQIEAAIKPNCLGGALRTIPFYCREAIRSSFDPTEPYTSVIDIPVIRIQDAIGTSTAQRILIKLDIEGMEYEALSAYVPTEQRAVYIIGELHDYVGQASMMEDLFHKYGWRIQFHSIADGYALFRACSPAALPLLPAMQSAEPVLA